MAKRQGLGPLGCLVGLMVLTAQPGWTAPISLGDFAGTTVVFQNVVADDGVLFGPAVLSGDSLEFEPRLTSASSGGGSQMTLGTLTLGVSAQPGFVIDGISASESGLYSLLGSGTSATDVLAAILLEVTVDEVDGNPIAPVSWNVNASVSFNLLANPGLDDPWSMGVSASVMNGLILNSVPFSFGATHVLITVPNTLSTESESNSSASIGKDTVRISATTSPIAAVPEPGTAGLWILGIGVTAVYRRLRRSQVGLDVR